MQTTDPEGTTTLSFWYYPLCSREKLRFCRENPRAAASTSELVLSYRIRVYGLTRGGSPADILAVRRRSALGLVATAGGDGELIIIAFLR